MRILRHKTPLLWSLFIMATILLAMTAIPSDKPASNGFEVEEFATGLDTPWGMAFLPDGRMLVTEKVGNLRYISPDGTVSEPIKGIPEVCVCGQGGLLDVQVHPDYANNGWVYLAYSDKKGGLVASDQGIRPWHEDASMACNG